MRNEFNKINGIDGMNKGYINFENFIIWASKKELYLDENYFKHMQVWQEKIKELNQH